MTPTPRPPDPPPLTHAALFADVGLDDLCGLGGPQSRDHEMRGSTEPSVHLLDGLDRSRLVIDEELLVAHRPTLLKALYAEHDADLFCQELDRRVATGRLALGPAFRAFERLWRRDELDHTVGFARLFAVLYREDEAAVLTALRRREADFTPLEPFLADEFSICLLLAYDELATTLSYAEDWKLFYPRFGDERLTGWMKRLAADEARHYGNLIRVLTTVHRNSLPRAVRVMDAIHALDLERPEYRGTFVPDHDDPAVFPAAHPDECRRRVAKSLGLAPAAHPEE